MMQVDIPEGWIAHDGGPCPVDLQTHVEVILRCGEIINNAAIELEWNHLIGRDGMSGDFDIVAYKPETPDA